MNIYILCGHPFRKSFCGHLTDLYEQRALASGHNVRVQFLGEMKFDPILHMGYKDIQALESDLLQAQENILWCNHWVIIYPVWWGSVPALLKGFLDRTLHPGFAFKYRENSPWWDKYLKGRSAELIATSDAPGFWLNWMYRASDFRTLKTATLEFCGIKPVKTHRLDRVKHKNIEILVKEAEKKILSKITKA